MILAHITGGRDSLRRPPAQRNRQWNTACSARPFIHLCHSTGHPTPRLQSLESPLHGTGDRLWRTYALRTPTDSRASQPRYGWSIRSDFLVLRLLVLSTGSCQIWLLTYCHEWTITGPRLWYNEVQITISISNVWHRPFWVILGFHV